MKEEHLALQTYIYTSIYIGSRRKIMSMINLTQKKNLYRYLWMYNKRNCFVIINFRMHLVGPNQSHIVHNATYQTREMDMATVLKSENQSLQEDPFQELAELDCLKLHNLQCILLRSVWKRDVLQSYHNHNLYPGWFLPAKFRPNVQEKHNSVMEVAFLLDIL